MNKNETHELYTHSIGAVQHIGVSADELEARWIELKKDSPAGIKIDAYSTQCRLLQIEYFKNAVIDFGIGDHAAGWNNMLRGLDCFEFALQGEYCCIFVPENYKRTNIAPAQYFNNIAVALAAGDIKRSIWAASHLQKLFPSRTCQYWLRDADVAPFLKLITNSLVAGHWPNNIRPLAADSIYMPLFTSAHDKSILALALERCCDFHMERVEIDRRSGGDGDPQENMFISPAWLFMPVELLYWRGLYELHHGPLTLQIDHPLWTGLFMQTRPPQPRPARNPLFEILESRAKAVWKTRWDESQPPPIPSTTMDV